MRHPQHSITPRVALIVFIFLIYFAVWRPARIALTEHVIYPQIVSAQSIEASYRSRINSGLILINYQITGADKELHYRFGFGFFFLLALAALIVINPRPKWYVLLMILHVTTALLALIGLIIGTSGIAVGFTITDMVSSYLAPALSLAIVPLVSKTQSVRPKPC